MEKEQVIMNDFICLKCKKRQNHIFLIKDLGICIFCNTLFLKEEIKKHRDFVDKLLNQAYLENEWNDKK